MKAVVEMRDVLVASVDGQGVLREVVGSDAEEVTLRGEDVGGQRGGHPRV